MSDLENRNILRGRVESRDGSEGSAVAFFQPDNLSASAPSNHFLCFLRSVREFLNCSARVVGIVASSTSDRRSFSDEILRLGGCERFDKYVVSHVGIIWREIGSQRFVNNKISIRTRVWELAIVVGLCTSTSFPSANSFEWRATPEVISLPVLSRLLRSIAPA